MTRIVAHPPTSTTSQWSSLPPADGQSSNQNDFASLLAGEPTTEGIDLVGPASAAVDDAKLRQAVAEVFNAHGFFASGSVQTEVPTKTRPNEEDAEASRQLPAQNAASSNPRDPDESVRFDRSEQIQFGNHPTPSTGREVAIQRRSYALPSYQPSALQPVARQPIGTGSVIASTAGNVPEPPNDKLSPPRRAVASSTADRLIFQIGTHVVQLTGRMQGLGKDEQEELVARLTALLERHGLSIGAATLNGRQLTSTILRSNH